ncbi:hypothetical protein BK749_16155 [Bacillus thuringiensis serovar vazensis]|uniref:Uncharacterized protein n=1 Tax=Bacillus thuringiensis serovar vazensis TaxID=180867 RepID=A0A243CXF7_BACTU|nr:hypothetical protein BK749_16155 [Bacillus thuringiensis serovar vazensis]
MFEHNLDTFQPVPCTLRNRLLTLLPFYDYEIKKYKVEIMYKINVSNTKKNISMLLKTHRSILFSFELTLFF